MALSLDELMIMTFENAHVALMDKMNKALAEKNTQKVKVIQQQMDVVLAELQNAYSVYAGLATHSSYLDGITKLPVSTIDKKTVDALTDSLAGKTAQQKTQDYRDFLSANFSAVHLDAIDTLLQESVNMVGGAVAGTRRHLQRKLAQAQREQIQQDLAVGLATGEAQNVQKKATIQLLRNAGVTGFQDAGGRTRDLQRYGDMIVRTERIKAYNTGHVTMGLELGITLYKRLEDTGCCKLCEPRRDKIRDIQKDGPIPFMQIHPNCRGTWVAVV